MGEINIPEEEEKEHVRRRHSILNINPRDKNHRININYK